VGRSFRNANQLLMVQATAIGLNGRPPPLIADRTASQRVGPHRGHRCLSLKSHGQYARPVELDHVLIAVADLAEAAQEMRLRHGLSSVEGGRHPAWGTANRIVPLGDSYLELVAVVDPARAAMSAFGRWVASGASTTAQPIGWAVRTSQLDEIAQRLDLPVHAGSRTAPGGNELHWRSAGIDEAAAEPSLPFFIQWAPRTLLPGQAHVRHPAGAANISRLVLHADPGRLTGWLRDHQLPIVVVHEGKPAVAAIYVSSEAAEIVISSAGS
jgi:hypothetical protein